MIAVIDYKVGNLRSVEKALHFIGYDAQVSSDHDFILSADAVILPGVGAFADAMNNLEKLGMRDVILSVIESGKPFLGICLGMQLLFECSEEGGDNVQGLSVLKGAIRLLPQNMNLKVPHMGWNLLDIKGNSPLFSGLSKAPYVYFVHSYYLDTPDEDIVIARTSYGITFPVAVQKGNVFATQFHPEKSGEVGLEMLRNFAKLAKLDKNCN
ncbi:imidazole glycerol phosphate synthase subunit HisH [Acetivibrio clariflavus]|uniref:Imidazole glycerol phosphate synthase subunit HisH n=1 Tax=Acetivibrio clariflavus (strain DSM 19732 / NBRC 101661 / EBR45) TaxID=720554 RepID=G8M2J5_ACECE|nr:imidazole glycerol phosphate synthase subunit HisH [Acetivibrio clariflavus]AEV70365.1 imidazole glycerol phosphate synthase subunit hisH [Acetivibrio clariflavus DSM 19732]HOQ01079.1 imidazole glycerol phosphate synthase subunit HisH [Acetivibrio clariflavus]